MSVAELVERCRAELLRIDGAVRARDASIGSVIRPPARPDVLAAVREGLGGSLPDEVDALYRVTDGLDLFGYEIVPLEHLLGRQAFLLDSYDDIQGSGLATQYWGSIPEGPTLALCSNDGVFLLVETAGSQPGRLTAFESVFDLGYREVAPSIGALLACWAEIAEAGLFAVEEGPGSPYVYVPEELHDQVTDVLLRTPCGPAAVWILGTAPQV